MQIITFGNLLYKVIKIFFLILFLQFLTPIFSQSKILEIKNEIIILQEGWLCINEDEKKFSYIGIDESNWKKVILPTFFAINDLSKKQVIWCRLNFKFHDKINDIGIKLSNIINAHEIFINEKKIGGQGIISDDGKLISPNSRPYLYKIEKKILKLNDNLISIRVADSSKSVGFLEEPKIGNWELLEKDFYLGIGKNFAFCFILLFLALYHIALFIPNKTDKSYLYFSLICFFNSIYIFAYYKLTYWVYDNYDFHFFCQHVSMNLMNLFIPVFINKLFETKMDFFSKLLTKFYLIILLFSIISVFYDEMKFYYRSYIVFINITFMLFFISIEIFRKSLFAFKRKQIEAKIISFGSTSLAFSLLLYLFKFFDLGVKNIYVIESFFVFIFSIAIAMAVKFRISQEKIIQREANYSLELENEVGIKTEELALMNKTLEKSNNLKDNYFQFYHMI